MPRFQVLDSPFVEFASYALGFLDVVAYRVNAFALDEYLGRCLDEDIRGFRVGLFFRKELDRMTPTGVEISCLQFVQCPLIVPRIP